MKAIPLELKWSLVIVCAAIFWSIIERLLGWHDNLIEKRPLYSLLFFIPVIILYGLAIREKRETFYDGNMTWAEGFKSGLILSVFVAILSLPAQWIIYKFISPDYFTNAINHAITSDIMSENRALEEYNLRTYLSRAPIISFFSGFIFSAVTSIFVKRT